MWGTIVWEIAAITEGGMRWIYITSVNNKINYDQNKISGNVQQKLGQLMNL